MLGMNTLMAALNSEKANEIIMCHIAVLPVRKIKAKKKTTENVREYTNFLLFDKVVASFSWAEWPVISVDA